MKKEKGKRRGLRWSLVFWRYVRLAMKHEGVVQQGGVSVCYEATAFADSQCRLKKGRME